MFIIRRENVVPAQFFPVRRLQWHFSPWTARNGSTNQPTMERTKGALLCSWFIYFFTLLPFGLKPLPFRTELSTECLSFFHSSSLFTSLMFPELPFYFSELFKWRGVPFLQSSATCFKLTKDRHTMGQPLIRRARLRKPYGSLASARATSVVAVSPSLLCFVQVHWSLGCWVFCSCCSSTLSIHFRADNCSRFRGGFLSVDWMEKVIHRGKW